MSSHTVTFYGSNLTMVLGTSGAFTAEGIYSDWKDWVVLSDNAKYPKAFDTTGGDDVGGNQEIAPYFFVRNDLGWIIKMPTQDGEIVVTGNLFPRDSTAAMFAQQTGYDAFLRLEVSTRAVIITVPTEVSALTTAQGSQLAQIAAVKTSTDLIPAQAAEVTGIKTSTDLIPAQAAEVTAVKASTDLIPAQAAEVTGIKTSTDLIPAQAAEVTGIKTSTDLIPAQAAEVTGIKTSTDLIPAQAAEVTAVKASTDLIPALL